MRWNSYISSGGVRSKTFNDYASARNHFEAVKPIRGRSPELRPLGSNRAYTQCKIELDELTFGVSATLYQTECVTIYPDKTIKINRDNWLTPSTANFIDAVLPSKFGSVYLSKRRLIYKSPTGQEFVIPNTSNGIVLQVSDDWSTASVKVDADADKEPKLYEYKVDRKKLNAIRRTIKPLLDTVHVMSSMSNHYSIHEVAQYFPEVINEYVDKVNEHERKMLLKEAGDESLKNYYGHFYGTYALRHLVADKAGLPMIRHLSQMGEYYKEDPTGKRIGNHATYKHYTSAYLSMIAKVFSASMPSHGTSFDDAESIRKLMLSVVLNESNYGIESRDYPEVKVDTQFGEVSVGNLEWSMSGNALESYIIDVIKYVYADLIFTKVEVPYGSLPSVANNKYIYCNKYLVEQEDIITRRYIVQ